VSNARQMHVKCLLDCHKALNHAHLGSFTNDDVSSDEMLIFDVYMTLASWSGRSVKSMRMSQPTVGSKCDFLLPRQKHLLANMYSESLVQSGGDLQTSKSNAKGQRHRSGSKVDIEDNLITEKDLKEYQDRTYEDLSSKFQRLYPKVLLFITLYV